MTVDDSQYYAMSEEVVEYMFTTDFGCYQPEIQYSNPYEYEAAEDNGDDQEGDDNVPEASQWCQALFNRNMEPVDLDNCGAYQDENGGNDMSKSTTPTLTPTMSGTPTDSKNSSDQRQ